jgi:hypothetical protein
MPINGENEMSVKSLMDHQIAAMVEDISRLDNSGGSDSAALARIRTTVSRELLTGDVLEITMGALGVLEQDSAAQRLMDAVSYCSEHFQMEDRILSAVVLPVSIQLCAKNMLPMSICTGERSDLRELATKMVQTMGTRKVIFDTRLYKGADLNLMKYRDLREFLLQLEAGIFYPKGGPRGIEVQASSDAASWQLVFFLGVEVTDLQSYPRLNDWPIQTQSTGWRDHPSASIEYSNEVLLNEDIKVRAESHGVFYLLRGLEAGERGLRSLRIGEMLTALGTNGAGLKIFCTHDENTFQMRTLMISPLMTLEHKWRMYRDENLWEFQRELERLALATLPEFDPMCIASLEEEEYASEAKKHQVPLFRLVGKAT